MSVYSIGCPVWNCAEWLGSVYPCRTPRREWLQRYSEKFNCVEGNSTFYGIPSQETVRRWADESADGFRFVLKFPRIISHDQKLLGVESETDTFLRLLDILKGAGRLGPTFLQLPPSFGPEMGAQLESYLERLPADFDYAVELRHPDWFQEGVAESMDSMLSELRVDRVIFDSRPLFSAEPGDDAERASQGRKPQVPIRRTVTNNYPILRLIGRNSVEQVDPWIDEWTDEVRGWIKAGRYPFVFIHTPDDRFAPALAHRFHRALSEKMALRPLPALEVKPPTQLELF